MSSFSSSFHLKGFDRTVEGLNSSPSNIFFLDHNREVNLCKVKGRLEWHLDYSAEVFGFMGRSMDLAMMIGFNTTRIETRERFGNPEGETEKKGCKCVKLRSNRVKLVLGEDILLGA